MHDPNPDSEVIPPWHHRKASPAKPHHLPAIRHDITTLVKASRGVRHGISLTLTNHDSGSALSVKRVNSMLVFEYSDGTGIHREAFIAPRNVSAAVVSSYLASILH